MRSVVVLAGPDATRGLHHTLARRFRQEIADDVASGDGVTSRAQLVADAVAGARRGDLVAVVGFTNAVEVSQASITGHVVLLPDLPGHGGLPYPSVVRSLTDACRWASLVVVEGGAEQLLLERHVPGLAGKVAVVDGCGPRVEHLRNERAQTTSSGADVRVCVVAEDLRHAANPVRALLGLPGVVVDSPVWQPGADRPTTAVADAMEAADVVFCDWAGRHAVWAARHRRDGQRLVVRLHGYELGSTWIGQLDVDEVDAVIVVSEHWRRRVIESLGWPSEKVRTIPNAVDSDDLARPKHPGARFHLGMLGWAPMLKRPDLAVQLISRLVEADPRYVLHLRGSAPWELDWLWERRIRERVAYQSLLRMIGADSRILRAVRFEPYGADVADWYRGIGWTLSLSDVESFHVAAVEGMAAGSVPVVRAREGAEDVLGLEHVSEDLEAAVRRIVDTGADRWKALSDEARYQALRYDVSKTREAWRGVLLGG